MTRRPSPLVLHPAEVTRAPSARGQALLARARPHPRAVQFDVPPELAVRVEELGSRVNWRATLLKMLEAAVSDLEAEEVRERLARRAARVKRAKRRAKSQSPRAKGLRRKK